MAIKRKDDDMLTNPRVTNAPRLSGDPHLDQAILENLNNPNRTNAPNISGNPYLDQQILANNPTLGTTPQMPTTPIYPRTSQSVPDAPSTPEAPGTNPYGTNPTLWKTAVAATTPTTTPAAQAVPAGAQPAANPAAAANAAPLESSVEYWANQIYQNGKFLNPYQAGYDAKYAAIMNRQPFSYDLESDPQWQAYRDQYSRLGQRAYDDALARMSARTGGLASSYAGSAAAQAYGGYMQQMTDKIPELYRLAYDMYSQDAARDIADLNAIRGMAGDAYDWWQGDFNRLGTALSVAQSQRDYDEAKDAAKLFAYGDGDPYEIGSQKGQYFVKNAQPEQTMVGGDGSIWTKEADGSVTITNNGHTWKIQAPAKAVKSSGGGSGGSTKTIGKPDLTVAQVNSAIKNGILTDKVMDAYEYYYGEPYNGEKAESADNINGNVYGGGLTGDDEPNISNRYGDSWVAVPGMGRVTWQELYGMVEEGRVEEDYDPETNTVTYRRKGG